MAKVLIVEDDRAISDLIRLNLNLVGHTCIQAFDSDEAKALVNSDLVDLILLDVMIPRVDGFTLLEQRAFGNTPTILVTAKALLADRVQGLRLGADDYIVKPFETVELLARVDAVLRRTQKNDTDFMIQDTVISLKEHTASVEGKEVELTNREFELLTVLLQNRNIALSREQLLDLAWGYDYYGDTRTVDVHIVKLRKKLHLEAVIKTVYKLGYRLEWKI